MDPHVRFFCWSVISLEKAPLPCSYRSSSMSSFTMSFHVRLFDGWSVCLSVCNNFLKGREVTLPCSIGAIVGVTRALIGAWEVKLEIMTDQPIDRRTDRVKGMFKFQ